MQEKPTYNSKTDTKNLTAIIIYISVLFVGGSIFTYMFAYLFSLIFNEDYKLIIDSIVASDLSIYSENVIKANSLSQGCANLLGYILSFIGIAIVYRKELIIDFTSIKEKKKFYLYYILIAAVAFVGISYLIDLIFSNIVSSSANQSTIETILRYGGAIPMIIATILFAPIVEELIYRKCIFSACKNKGVVFSYVISIIAFTLPHMLSTSSDVLTWLVQCIPYALCGGLLCLIYHKSNYNVYPVIIAHMLNNILAVILVFI